MHYDHKNSGVCSTMVHFDIDDDKKVRNVSFDGGCNGNLKAIARLVEGKDAAEVRDILLGNTCGMRPTSCADQFARAIEEVL